MEKLTKTRLDYIDVTRGIGIILVVLGHLNPGEGVERWIYSFHMPLFFVISGLLCRDMPVKWKKRLFPYVKWWIFSLLFGMIPLVHEPSSLKEFLFLNGSVGYNSPLWFLIVLL